MGILMDDMVRECTQTAYGLPFSPLLHKGPVQPAQTPLTEIPGACPANLRKRQLIPASVCLVPHRSTRFDFLRSLPRRGRCPSAERLSRRLSLPTRRLRHCFASLFPIRQTPMQPAAGMSR